MYLGYWHIELVVTIYGKFSPFVTLFKHSEASGGADGTTFSGLSDTSEMVVGTT